MPAQQLLSERRSKMTGGVMMPFNPSSQQLVRHDGQANDVSFADVDLSGYYPHGQIVVAAGAGKGKGGATMTVGSSASTSADSTPPTNRRGGSVAGPSPNFISRRQWGTVLILFFVNLINYMDRLTIAGILSKVQKEYSIGDAEGGALQTAFVVSYMVFAPIFGYLGDRHSRKLIMAVGVLVWTVFTVVGSFMQDYYSFLLCRAMVGVGEASYSTIAPTIISDMFVKDVRSKMLALFYFAIPLGSGLGYVVGAETAQIANDWRWGLRVTPILGVVAVVLILFYMNDPPRGESEGHGELRATTYGEDLRSLAKNRSFVFSTVAFTCVAFCTGALSWWGPRYIESAVASMPKDQESPIGINNVSLIFGFVTMLSGIVGVPLGSILSTKLKQKHPRADPLICAAGLVISAVFLGVGMFVANSNIYLAFLLLFLGEVALNLNWSIVADILLYVVVPTRRSSAEAVQILISHALGDAGSPYLIGVVSDALRGLLASDPTSVCGEGDALSDVPHLSGLAEAYPANHTRCDFAVDYTALQYSLFINNFVEVVGGIFFAVTAVYIIRDKLKCDRYIAEQKATKAAALLAKKPEFQAMLVDGKHAYPAAVFKGESESVSTDDDDEVPPQLQLILPPA